MLGINGKRELITGKFANEIRKRMQRIQTGRLNENDQQEIRKHKQVMKDVIVIWK